MTSSSPAPSHPLPEPESVFTVEKPNLRKSSVLMATVKSIAVGAAVGLGFEVAAAGLAQLLRAEKIPFKQLLAAREGTIQKGVIFTALASGVAGWASAETRNRLIADTKPYVEALEHQNKEQYQGIASLMTLLNKTPAQGAHTEKLQQEQCASHGNNGLNK